MTGGSERRPILAVAPVHRGFGFVVMDQSGALLDWGVKETRRDKHAACRARVSVLITVHQPCVLVLERTGGPECRRRTRIRNLIRELAKVGRDKGVKVALWRRSAVHQVFGIERLANKDRLAAVVANTIPALAHRLPRPRKTWESEHHSMAIFDAAAFAATHQAIGGG